MPCRDQRECGGDARRQLFDDVEPVWLEEAGRLLADSASGAAGVQQSVPAVQSWLAEQRSVVAVESALALGVARRAEGRGWAVELPLPSPLRCLAVGLDEQSDCSSDEESEASEAAVAVGLAETVGVYAVFFFFFFFLIG